MPCYHPLHGWWSKERSANGKRFVVFDFKKGLVDRPITVPCGQCVGCRLERSRQWAIRCLHEASLYESNCFITLTFNDANLPYNSSLDVRIFQKFMKRLRKKFGDGIRFFHCGEYGEQFGRPHYHAIIFNLDFNDKVYYKSQNGYKLYTSEVLSRLWPYGYATIGSVTFDSAAYVARYIMKKITGEQSEAHYEWVHPETGEVFNHKPEYVTMSRRPGIGHDWYNQFKDDVYPKDFVIIKGAKVRPPRYYDKCFEVEFPSDMSKLKVKRLDNAKKDVDFGNDYRLLVKEKVKLSQIKRLVRHKEI